MPDDLMSLRAYSRLVGRSPSTIRMHGKLYGAPCAEGDVSRTEMLVWLHGFLVENRAILARLLARDDGESRAEAERRLKVAQAARAELLLERERGALIDRGQAEADRRQLVQWMVSVFERAGSELQSALAAADRAAIKTIVDGYFDRLREELASGAGVD